MRQTYLTALGGRTRVVPRRVTWLFMPRFIHCELEQFVPWYGGRFLRDGEVPEVDDFSFWAGVDGESYWRKLTKKDEEFAPWLGAPELWRATTVTLRP